MWFEGVPTGDSQNNNAEFITKNRYKNRDKGNNCLDGKPNEDWEFGNNCLERSLTSFHPPFNESEGTYLQKFLYISIILVFFSKLGDGFALYIFYVGNCMYSAWNRWSACTKKCDGGMQYRERKGAAWYGGIKCTKESLGEKRICNRQRCRTNES